MEEKTKTKYWWMKDLVDSEAKAMGTYIALFHLLRNYGPYYRFEVKPSGALIMREEYPQALISKYLAGRKAEVKQALEAGKAFIERLFEHEDVLDWNKRRQILYEIEAEFYDDFVKAFEKYLSLDVIPEKLKDKVRELLLYVRTQGIRETPVGTILIYETAIKEILKRTYHELKEEINELLSCLWESGLAIEERVVREKKIPRYIFPAPCLSDEIIELVMKPPEVKPLIPPPPKPERFDIKPSKEILEGIVTSVFEDLGFEASTNVKKEPRRGSPIEVDVWAWKRVAGTRFSVYVSCKNWDKAIDRPVIDEEAGRVLNLRELPQLKVIIAKELAAPAKEVAETDGFIVIELGKKAEAENAREIYELIYRTLNELFTSIAPPRLREIASKLAEVRENLKKIEEELASLSTK